ncbi:MAG: hypothetical protein QOJ16_2950 [Acidobacteriota bacterium]|jgi:hypothetical protein|nr:hypothetical protein [Acidobacteriota bacterium]
MPDAPIEQAAQTVPAKSLVLVIGAGASKEANLPAGAELKKMIADALDIRYNRFENTSGDDLIAQAFLLMAQSADQHRGDIDPYLYAAWRVRDAMPQAISIDNFIDSHRGDQDIALCGKLAIASCILAAERASKLYVDPGNVNNKINFSAVEDTWFNSFFQLLTESCEQADLPDRLSKVAIVCFNYDRCIEHYLHAGLQNYYGMRPEAATDVLSSLEIHHPYGTVGKLPWQSQQDGFAFGAIPRPPKLLEFVHTLRTFTEGIDPERSDISAIRSTLSTAERIAFLGFAYHRLNLQLLFPFSATGPARSVEGRVYATANGISNSDLQEITSELGTRAKFRLYVFISAMTSNAMICFESTREVCRSRSHRIPDYKLLGETARAPADSVPPFPPFPPEHCRR